MAARSVDVRHNVTVILHLADDLDVGRVPVLPHRFGGDSGRGRRDARLSMWTVHGRMDGVSSSREHA